MTDIEKAIEASSLGTREAKARRRRVPRAMAARIVAASAARSAPKNPRMIGGKG